MTERIELTLLALEWRLRAELTTAEDEAPGPDAYDKAWAAAQRAREAWGPDAPEGVRWLWEGSGAESSPAGVVAELWRVHTPGVRLPQDCLEFHARDCPKTLDPKLRCRCHALREGR